MKRYTTCPVCASTIDTTATRCPVCGQRFPENEEESMSDRSNDAPESDVTYYEGLPAPAPEQETTYYEGLPSPELPDPGYYPDETE
jgi:predicted nucleic acid-binding Zn ribbon protein